MESRKVSAKSLIVGAKIRWVDGEFKEVIWLHSEQNSNFITVTLKFDDRNRRRFHIKQDDMVEVAYEFPVYPAGTPITEVTTIDRGIKLHYKCSDHEWCQWSSKDPMVSRWFPANLETVEKGMCECTNLGQAHWILASDYKPTRND